MKSVGALLGCFDSKQMAIACIWLETGAPGESELPERTKEDNIVKTVVTHKFVFNHG